jgi:cold shock CspA family protein
MQRPTRIISRDFPLTETIETEIREKVEGLERYYDRLGGCDVTIEAPAIHHHRKGGPFIVRIRMLVPGRELDVAHQAEEELAVAIREAFHAARRLIEDYSREQRGAVKTHDTSARGRITRLEPELDYGFLQADDGREIYFHRNSIVNGHFDKLEVGNEVRFTEEAGDKGPQASSVVVAKSSHHG